MQNAYLENVARGRKAYAWFMEPVCRQWSLTRNEIDVLLFLYNNPGLDRAADIVQLRGLVKSHVSLSVSHMEELGLLRRWADPSDRRTVHIELTEAALPVARDAEKKQREFLQQMLAGIPEEELEVYHSVTQKIKDNIFNLVLSEKEES